MKRGLTLMEVLVAAGLGLVVLTLAATVLYATSTSTARNHVRVDLQQQAMQACDWMVSDLTQCTPAGVGVLYSNDANVLTTVLSLHKVVDVNNVDPPAPIFDRKLTLYARVGTALYRGTSSATQSQSVATRGGSQADLMNMGSTLQGRRLAENLQALQITCPNQPEPPAPYQANGAPPPITNPLCITLVMEKEVKGGTLRNLRGNPCERFRLQRTVWFRDGE
ncbi:hypothetical protein JST97_03150 [bacterium]|nr:hypothetical protein [bacterium]